MIAISAKNARPSSSRCTRPGFRFAPFGAAVSLLVLVTDILSVLHDYSIAFPVKKGALEPLYLFVFTHYPTQNRFALLLEMHFCSYALSHAKPLRTFAGNALVTDHGF